MRAPTDVYGTVPLRCIPDQGGEHDGSGPPTAEPVEAIAPGEESVSAADLPF